MGYNSGITTMGGRAGGGARGGGGFAPVSDNRAKLMALDAKRNTIVKKMWDIEAKGNTGSKQYQKLQTQKTKIEKQQDKIINNSEIWEL